LFTESINNIELSFETDDAVFSPLSIDKGTLAMLSVVEFTAADKVLDLGSGYGVVGIYAAKLIGEENIVMSDINKNSFELSRKNAEKNGVGGVKVIKSNGFENIQETDFTLILSNPPYHADFSVPKHFIEKGFNRLKISGRMFMVTKRKDWYKNKFIAIFGGVKIHEINEYFVFCAEKRSKRYARSGG